MSLVCMLAPAFARQDVPMLIEPAFDASYPDSRTSTSIQQDIARALAGDAKGVIVGDPDDLSPAVGCFDPATPPSEASAMGINAMHRSFGTRYQINGSWAVSQGSPVTLTWSLVPDGLNIGSGNGEPAAPSTLFATMDSKFASAGGRAVWIAQVEAAFARWSQISGINYVRVSAPGQPWDDGSPWGTSGNGTTRGEVRVSCKPIDGAGSILAYNFFPTASDMVIDADENWATSANTFRRMRNIFMHELGHGLGFLHNCPRNQSKLMEPFLSTQFDGPQQDDIRASHANYGDVYEPNGSAATAFDLGTLAAGATFTLGTLPGNAVANASALSLTGAGDRDLFRFRLDSPQLIRVVARPLGTTYLNGPQGAGEGTTCSEGSDYNALDRCDLIVGLAGPDGISLQNSIDTNTAGNNETMAGGLGATGVNHIRITSDSQSFDVQLYLLDVQVLGPAPRIVASDGSFTDRVALSWSPVPDATQYRVLRSATTSVADGELIATTTATSIDDTTALPNLQYRYWLQVTQAGGASNRLTTAIEDGEPGLRGQPPCNDVDFNNNTVFPEDQDIIDFFDALAGAECGTCDSVDFNNNGIFPEDQDIVDFFAVLAGGAC